MVSSIKYDSIILFYSTINSQNTTDAYQIKLLNDLTEKVNQSTEIINKQYPKNQFNVSTIPGTCTSCHIAGRMDIVLPKEWALQNFKEYVRGTIRIPNNDVMPKFDSKMISDDQLEKIFIYIKTRDHQVQLNSDTQPK